MPLFTVVFLGSLMGLVYLVERGLEWYFMIPLSPTMILLQCVPVGIGLLSLTPRMVFYVKFLCAKQDNGIAPTGIGEKLSSWLIGGVRWVISGFWIRPTRGIVLV
jgi:hypothetical protein